ncbi:diguanylate cyclase (GGDEF)-like protein [Deinococcus metalli]|uniref:Diguanylate cyclase n=1 Tax=Deinococcus metalli TaxID=1141878 RepID=A0A7W8KEN1_9DEIO|nr:HD domain-containing phosphohydrolase [Deinococcus metalli]MBB5376363.1 diguanylate cyclase (GGDEF)-like protein [Deinococcus metalli]GHF38852.1 diguanylate cyclase [Deinococcus metalli]
MTATVRSALPAPRPPEAVETVYERLAATLGDAPDTAVGRALAFGQSVDGQGALAYGLAQLLLGHAHVISHAPAQALEPLERAAAQLARASYPAREAEARSWRGRALLELGQNAAAAEVLDDAAQFALAHGASSVAADALNRLAAAHHHQGQVAEALHHLHRALDLRQQVGDVKGELNCLTNIATIQTWMGQYREAVASLSRAYALYQTLPQHPATETPILHSLAHVHHMSGDDALALEVMEAAHRSADRSGDPRLQAATSLNLGVYLLGAGRHAEAQAALQRALHLSRAAAYTPGELGALDSLGQLADQTGDPGAAQEAYERALTLALSSGSVHGETGARLNLGSLLLRAGQLDAAREHFSVALTQAQDAQLPKERAQAHQGLADVCEHAGDLRGALDHSRALRAIERELFNADRDRQTRNLSLQFEVERARQDARMYQVRTELEYQGREQAERLVRERTAELARAQHEVVTRLAMAAEYRDDTTGEHTRRVGRAAAQIARALGWSPAEASVLGVAARLHDVGKIGIPDAILLKRGRLTPDEFEQMQTHTEIGARILSGGRSALLQLAEEIARTHHERWDGGGYPHGLRGTAIPLAGRIVAVADVFDALTQSRPYKTAWTASEAMHAIAEGAGTQFDPDIVALAAQVLGQADEPDVIPAPPTPDDPLPFDQEDASHMLAVFEQLLTERTRELELARHDAEQTAAHMEHMAHTDPLTGLHNRRAFEQALEERLGSAPPTDGPARTFTVLSLDVDGLKTINDTQGHAQGDAFLACFATALRDAYADHGAVYRIGGDEFAIICDGSCTDVDLTRAHDDAVRRVHAQGFTHGSISVGGAHYPDDATSAGDLLRLSDQRMYHDKLSRRHQRH